LTADHFETLLRGLHLEGEAEASELTRRQRTSGAGEQSGSSLTGLVIRDETVGFGGRATVTFGMRDLSKPLPWTRLNSGTPVIVSEEQAPDPVGIRGVVTGRDANAITIALADPPEPTTDRPLFRVDVSHDEIARQRQSRALKLARAAERGPLAILRRVLTGEQAPRFRESVTWQPLTSLDASQRAAVDLALSAEDLAVLHGPPGTGKTTVLIELIRQAIRRGQRVLACAPSNLAVDNLLERLVNAGERAVRIGHPARVLPLLRDKTLDIQVETHPSMKLAHDWMRESFSLRRQAARFTRAVITAQTRRELRAQARKLVEDAQQLEQALADQILDSATVVCATLTGLNPDLLCDREFDLAVIDEAAQTTEPACWIPALRCRTLILAGDHCQLPPTVLSPEARRQGFHVSLMERLMRFPNAPELSRQLTHQYRMHAQIMQFSSEEFYAGTLTAADGVREHRLIDLPGVTDTEWTSTAIRFVDTAGSGCEDEQDAQGSWFNPGEADWIAQRIQDLQDAGVRSEDMAVITPYSAQVRLLRERLADSRLEIDTVDGFQGREKEAILVSLVRSNARGEVGFLADTRRINVALTRARRLLVVVGDSSTLASHDFYLRLLDYFERAGSYSTVWG